MEASQSGGIPAAEVGACGGRHGPLGYGRLWRLNAYDDRNVAAPDLLITRFVPLMEETWSGGIPAAG
jgi:hypothetical protein